MSSAALTAPEAWKVHRIDPLRARSEYTVPSSEPKYTRPWSMSGEDSARLGSLRDQRTRPFAASSAMMRPPGEPL